MTAAQAVQMPRSYRDFAVGRLPHPDSPMLTRLLSRNLCQFAKP